MFRKGLYLIISILLVVGVSNSNLVIASERMSGTNDSKGVVNIEISTESRSPSYKNEAEKNRTEDSRKQEEKQRKVPSEAINNDEQVKNNDTEESGVEIQGNVSEDPGLAQVPNNQILDDSSPVPSNSVSPLSSDDQIVQEPTNPNANSLVTISSTPGSFSEQNTTLNNFSDGGTDYYQEFSLAKDQAAILIIIAVACFLVGLGLLRFDVFSWLYYKSSGIKQEQPVSYTAT